MARPAKIREEFDPATGDIRAILDMGQAVQGSTKDPKAQTGWYASSLGYCLRRQFLDRAGVPSTRKEDGVRRVFWIGDVLENAVINRLRQSGLLLAEQIHVVSTNHHASGYIDFIYGGHPVDEDPEELEGYKPSWARYLTTYKAKVREAWPNGVPITAVELKTANQYAAEKQFAEGPAFHNVMQGGFYEVVHSEEPEQFPEHIRKIDRFQLAVLAKSGGEMMVHDILESHKLKVLGRLDELNEAWPLELPPCTCGVVMGWEKTYCPYADGNGDCCDQGLIQNAPEDFWKMADAALAAREESAS